MKEALWNYILSQIQILLRVTCTVHFYYNSIQTPFLNETCFMKRELLNMANWFYFPIDNIICDHIKRFPLYLYNFFLTVNSSNDFDLANFSNSNETCWSHIGNGTLIWLQINFHTDEQIFTYLSLYKQGKHTEI
jgi:hypothetical protein